MEPTLNPSIVPTVRPAATEVKNLQISYQVVLPLSALSFVSSGAQCGDLIPSRHPTEETCLLFEGVGLGATATSVGSVVSLDKCYRSVSGLNDINGDGCMDIAVGDPNAAEVFVQYGICSLMTTVGFTIFGEKDSDLTGWSVGDAGDVNNDTLSDIVIGAPLAKGVGAVYVIYGRVNDSRDIYLSELTASQGFIVYGGQKADYFGISVSGAGDVNGDGFDDVIVGAVLTSKYFAGGACIVYGGQQRSMLSVSTSSLSVEEGYQLIGESYSYTGCSVTRAGDVNGDGIRDVVIGSDPQRSSLTRQSFVVLGTTAMRNSSLLTTLDNDDMYPLLGGGIVVASVGETNNDGADDLLVVPQLPSPSSGGFIVNLNVSQMTVLSSAPSVAPSIAATAQPTVSPSTRRPSIRPSAKPTVLPSVRPSMPTSMPLLEVVSIDSPSAEPSELPSEVPSESPTAAPSEVPSVQPTVLPSVNPSTHPSVRPTAAPSVIPSAQPQTSKRPFAAPTVLPTALALDTNVHITSSSELNYQLFPSMRYFVDTTGTVSIYNTMGNNTYLVGPRAGALLIIQYFNNTNDLIDLSLFTSITSFDQLRIRSGSVIIALPDEQIVRITNLRPPDVNGSNFVFFQDSLIVDDSGSFIRRMSIFVGMAIGFGSIFFILSVCLQCCAFVALRSVHWQRSRERFYMFDIKNEDEEGEEKQKDQIRNEVAYDKPSSLHLSELTINSDGDMVRRREENKESEDNLSEQTINSDGVLVSRRLWNRIDGISSGSKSSDIAALSDHTINSDGAVVRKPTKDNRRNDEDNDSRSIDSGESDVSLEMENYR